MNTIKFSMKKIQEEKMQFRRLDYKTIKNKKSKEV